MKKILLMLILLLTAPHAFAQAVGIAAVVGSDIISTADIENRIRLINLSQKQSGQGNMDPSLRPQVLEMLISERLYRQEAKRLKYKVSPEELENAVHIVEERNQMKPGGMKELLAKNNVPYGSFEDQLEAQLLWNKVLAAKIRPRVNVTDEEVKNAKNTIPRPERPKIMEVLISEIALPVESKAQDAAVKKIADSLIKDIRAGKSFAAVAREYSKSPTALSGGKVGWVIEQGLPPELAESIGKLQNGQVSGVIRSTRGYYIVKVDGRREALTPEQYAVKLQIKQVFAPIEFGTASKDVQAKKEELLVLAKKINTCGEFDKVIAGAMPQEPLGALDVSIKDIQPDLQNTLMRQAVNAGTSVVNSVSGLHLITICKRDPIPAAKVEKPVELDETTIRDLLFQKKIDSQGKHYLDNIRRKTEIDIR